MKRQMFPLNFQLFFRNLSYVNFLLKIAIQYFVFRFHDSEGNRVYPIREVFEELIEEGRQLSSPIISAAN